MRNHRSLTGSFQALFRVYQRVWPWAVVAAPVMSCNSYGRGGARVAVEFSSKVRAM